MSQTNHEIMISAGNVSVRAVLDQSATAAAIRVALPLRGNAGRWGDEIYFTIPVKLAEQSGARQEMAVGELGYWPVGAAFCLFFGPTPASDGSEPRAYSNVNPFGRILGDATVLREVRDGDPILVESA